MRQGPQINLLRPNDTVEVIRTACSIWDIVHMCPLNKAGAVLSAGAKLVIPPSENPWKHCSEGFLCPGDQHHKVLEEEEMTHLPRKPRCQLVFVASGPPCAAAGDAKRRLALRNGGKLPKKKRGGFLRPWLMRMKECWCLPKSVNRRADKVRAIHHHLVTIIT